MFAFLNSQFVSEEQARVSIFDRGFTYGDGLFETLRVYNGKPFRWGQHWQRLERGAEFLRIKVPFSSTEAFCLVEQLLEKNQLADAVLRINLSRGVGPRGYSIKGAQQPGFALTSHEVQRSRTPLSWKLATSALRLSKNDPLAKIKHSNKLLQVAARTEAEEKGADEALLLNNEGEIVEAATANFFWIQKGEVFTPPLSTGALPGITREVVLEICKSHKIPLKEKIVPREDFQADAAFLTASVLEFVEVTTIDRLTLSPSPLTAKIVDAYREVVKDECA
jgi:branched-chain amino acid aminotransferase